MSETNHHRSVADILKKMEVSQLNPMQLEADNAILNNNEVVLLSPTGTGKTLAFLLPIIKQLDKNLNEIQALIVVPTRELAIQIEQVLRQMGSGFKVNAVYGGRSGSKDKIEMKHTPEILIGTPGRIADHLQRENIDGHYIKHLVLDEFDKSLQIGFEKEMTQIVKGLYSVDKKILTSATQNIAIPSFVNLRNPNKLNYLGSEESKLQVKTLETAEKNKLSGLQQLLSHVSGGRGIIFCNFKDTIQFVSDFLNDNNIQHESFYGGLEQVERERALIKFRNGTSKILLATDLAARGIDVPELDFIIHFQLPFKKEEFTHRNGRTARMQSEGTAYLLKWKHDSLPDYIENVDFLKPKNNGNFSSSSWVTLYISGGRKDKISKGDIAGLFFKQGKLGKNELGVIELKSDCAFVSVPTSKSNSLIATLNNSRLKKKKVRISLLQ